MPSDLRQELLDDAHFETWSVDDVSDWLGRLRMDGYAVAFAEQNIDGKALIGLTPEDLERLGVTLGIHKQLIMQSIRTLAGHTNVSGIDLWTVGDVSKWLEKNDMKELVTCFQENEVTGDQLLSIHSADLIKFGVNSAVARQKFRKARDSLFQVSHNRLDVELWTTAEVSAWLEQKYLQDYIPVFTKANIDGAALLEITAERMQEIGVSNKVHRTMLLRNIAELRNEAEKGSGLPKNAMHWTNADVSIWLGMNNLDQLRPQFAAKGIDGKKLLELKSDDLPALLGSSPEVHRTFTNCLTLLTSRGEGGVKKRMSKTDDELVCPKEYVNVRLNQYFRDHSCIARLQDCSSRSRQVFPVSILVTCQ